MKKQRIAISEQGLGKSKKIHNRFNRVNRNVIVGASQRLALGFIHSVLSNLFTGYYSDYGNKKQENSQQI